MAGPVKFLLEASSADASHQQGPDHHPQAIRERWGLLPHTEVHFVKEGGRVFLEKDNHQPSRGQEAVQRLQQARLRTKLSTDQLLALLTRDGRRYRQAFPGLKLITPQV